MELKRDRLLQGGRYRIIESIGRGGFGVTYLAEQVMAKRRVCIKEFFPKDYYKRDGDTGALTLSSDGFGEMMGKFKAKFVKEAQTIATLNHANIIPIHDIFEENGTAYYVMDYIEGESLSGMVKRGGTMSERDAVAYIKQVASALEHIHEQQIMHLDVKPSNIMVRSKDNRAILIDFGLSKHYDATSGEATSTTPVGVSHGFAPMEQYQDGGVSTFSPETDIYSLGATLYYLVTGKVPPQATVVAEHGLPYLDNLSSNIRETIAKSMSYWRKDRPHTIKDFLTLLDNDEPIVAVLADESEKTEIVPHKPSSKRESNEDKPKQKKHRWWLWCLLLLFIIMLCISLKDLFRGGDNAKEVAKEEKRVEMPAEEVVTTPIESEPDVLGEQVEDEEEVTVVDPEEKLVSTRETLLVEETASCEELALLNKDTDKKLELPRDIMEEQVEDEEEVTVDDPVEEAVPTHEATPVEVPGPAEAPYTVVELVADTEEPVKLWRDDIEELVADEYGVTVVGPETSAPYKVGDLYDENGKQGVVFEVWDNGRHGKIVSLGEAALHWCTPEQYDKEIDLGLTDESDGKANTDKVMQRGDSDQYPAFVWCRNKGADWYLPAINELMTIYNNKSAINSTLAEYGARLIKAWYWSSTECEDYPEFCVWGVYMYDGDTLNSSKDNYYRVRAVSAF